MTALARKTSTSRISKEEMDRRREHVELAAHNSLMEGAKRDPRTDEIFQAYIQGEIELSDMLPAIKKALGDA